MTQTVSAPSAQRGEIRDDDLNAKYMIGRGLRVDVAHSVTTIDAVAALIGSLSGVAGIGSLVLSIVTFKRSSENKKRRRARPKKAVKRMPTVPQPATDLDVEDQETTETSDDPASDDDEEAQNV